MSKAKPFNPLTMTDEELIKHCDKQVQALRMALDMIECEKHDRRHVRWAIVDALKEWKPALAKQPAQQEPVLQEIEQYRLQMAGISTAAIGYWKESDGIHPDYDTIALRDVAKLYAKYDELYRAQPVPHAVIAGALFDFMSWLTSRPKRIMLSSVDDASPAVDAIKDFAKMRGLSLDDAQVQTWQKALAEQPAQEPVAWMTKDGEIYKSACWPEHEARPLVFGDTSPPAKRTWVGLTDEEIEKLTVELRDIPVTLAFTIEAKLKEKNT